MKKIVVLLFVLVCSVVLTIKSNCYMKDLSVSFAASNVEALTDGDDYVDGGTLGEVEILCSKKEGYCWAGITYEDYPDPNNPFFHYTVTNCYSFTGKTTDYCVNAGPDVIIQTIIDAILG